MSLTIVPEVKTTNNLWVLYGNAFQVKTGQSVYCRAFLEKVAETVELHFTTRVIPFDNKVVWQRHKQDQTVGPDVLIPGFATFPASAPPFAYNVKKVIVHLTVPAASDDQAVKWLGLSFAIKHVCTKLFRNLDTQNSSLLIHADTHTFLLDMVLQRNLGQLAACFGHSDKCSSCCPIETLQSQALQKAV